MATRAAKFGRFTYTHALEFRLTANILSFLVKIGDRVLTRTCCNIQVQPALMRDNFLCEKPAELCGF